MTATGLPKGWSLPRLDQIARVTSGKRLPKGKSVTALATLHPYIRVTDMRMGKVDLSNIHYVPDHVAPKISRYTVDAGDLYISCAGTLGIVGIVPDVLHGANLTENANRISGIQVNPRFLLHVLMSEMIQGHIQNIQTVGAQPKLALGRIRSFEIPCPNDPKEQKAIAEALSDADALIEGLERLIAKKRLIKQGAMQDLLTAKRRLPGFSGDWETIPSAAMHVRDAPCGWRRIQLKELAVISAGGDYDSDTASPIETDRHPFPVYANAIERNAFHSYSSDSKHPAGAVTITARGTLGSSNFRAKPFTAIGRLLVVWPNSQFDGRYLAAYLNSQVEFAVESTGVPQLTGPQAGGYEILIPEAIGEQNAIAAVLEDMDAEIQALDTRLEKARQVKEGMMQNLLTGRIRLV